MKKITMIIFIFLVLKMDEIFSFNYRIIIINLFFKIFFLNYVCMMNFCIYIYIYLVQLT